MAGQTHLVLMAPSTHQFAAVELFEGAGTAATAVNLLKGYGAAQKWNAAFNPSGSWTTENGFPMEVYRTSLSAGGTRLTGDSAFFIQGKDVWRLVVLASSGFSVPDAHLLNWTPSP
jgi:hypothetical protein